MTQTLAHRQPDTARSPLVAFLCFLIAILEGFDLQVAGIAAPNLKTEFILNPATLGWFFSTSTVGLLIGALAGGRLSDRLGRERVLLWSVAGSAAIILSLRQPRT